MNNDFLVWDPEQEVRVQVSLRYISMSRKFYTYTLSDQGQMLKGAKLEILDSRVFTQIRPVWVG
jgi:hypothetical protein